MPPLTFEPYFRPQVWGGRNLATTLGKSLPAEGKFGEAWELSAHPHHVSQVAVGPCAGKSLVDLWETERTSVFGIAARHEPKFPLLVKFLDCHELLSVQVHPNDEQAARLIGDELGKTEAWIILDVAESGRVYAGLKPGVDEAMLTAHLAAGTVDQCLHGFKPAVGDCVFLPAGTVHAVGGGVVMAEVQQSSDATFRLFDWNRPGPDGKPRQLHIEQSLASIDWTAGPVAPRQPLAEALASEHHAERLVECPYFQLTRYDGVQSFITADDDSFQIWIGLGGELDYEVQGVTGRLKFGETMLLPARSAAVNWKPVGRGSALQVTR